MILTANHRGVCYRVLDSTFLPLVLCHRKHYNNRNNRNVIMTECSSAFVYFSIFTNQGPPILHSAKIPGADKDFSFHVLMDNSSGTVVEEVPHESLQKIAFPICFGASSLLLFPDDTGCGSDATVTEAPPWRLELEELRNQKREVKQYNIVLTSSFSVRVASQKGPMFSMQNKQAAVAMVVTCPPAGGHYSFLLKHFNVLRTMLNALLSFGIATVQRFFVHLLTYEGRREHTLRHISTVLENHPESLEIYAKLKSLLANALHVTPVVCSPVADGDPSAPTGAPLHRNEHFVESLRKLLRFSEPFTTALVLGVWCTRDPSEYGFVLRWVNHDTHGGCAECVDAASPTRRVELPGGDGWDRGSREDDKAPPKKESVEAEQGDASLHKNTTPSNVSFFTDLHELEKSPVSLKRISRVVIFSTDAAVAQDIVTLCSGLLTLSAAANDSECDLMDLSAGRTTAYDFADLPVQWIWEEYSEDKTTHFFSPYSLDTAILLVVPRLLLCRVLILNKYVESTVVSIEQRSLKEVKICSTKEPFHCEARLQETIVPDGVVSSILKESIPLATFTGRSAPCVDFLRSAGKWYAWTSLRQHLQAQETTGDLSCLCDPQNTGASPHHRPSRDGSVVANSVGGSLGIGECPAARSPPTCPLQLDSRVDTPFGSSHQFRRILFENCFL